MIRSGQQSIPSRSDVDVVVLTNVLFHPTDFVLRFVDETPIDFTEWSALRTGKIRGDESYTKWEESGSHPWMLLLPSSLDTTDSTLLAIGSILAFANTQLYPHQYSDVAPSHSYSVDVLVAPSFPEPYSSELSYRSDSCIRVHARSSQSFPSSLFHFGLRATGKGQVALLPLTDPSRSDPSRRSGRRGSSYIRFILLPCRHLQALSGGHEELETRSLCHLVCYATEQPDEGDANQ